MPERVQLRRTKGWRLPPNTITVARPSRWGNPFHVTADRTKAEAVAAFRQWLLARLADGEDVGLTELRGRNLACWCRPGEPCHADVLLELANRADDGTPAGVTGA